MQDTAPLLFPSNFPAIYRSKVEVVQVNLGYKCNLSCTHCHVNAGPKRTEMMSASVVDSVLEYLAQSGAKVLDLTGGAPELNEEFRRMVRKGRSLGVDVIDRCNLTILAEPGQEDLAEFLADNQVTVVASLPCYSEKNVREQRGTGVFESSIQGLLRLNQLGYGSDPKLNLNLVYNPNGAFLPPSQTELEGDYKAFLARDFGIKFNQLYTITNMPIKRFGATLLAKDRYWDYMNLLKSNFSNDNLDTLMCKSTISIDWQGFLYDCDFNQMLEMPMTQAVTHRPQTNADIIASTPAQEKLHIGDLLAEVQLSGWPIAVAEHCYGCTAGQGSSCGGALD